MTFRTFLRSTSCWDAMNWYWRVVCWPVNTVGGGGA